ncbi:crustacyanin-A2 subunit-like [Penaeus chinensis]|uniref:crustacyanin-A2 subunit-like n=1 Tax=Penaeus chinensis TaxID=139456 RepID=UPI001FB5DB97|nr:crustacyanin-A2 subunit-like [Penaeus chinensis]
MRGASLPYAVVVAGVVAVAEGLFGIPEFLELGGCANVTLMEDFDPVKYQGLWFDIASVPNEYQVTKQCISQNYTWTGNEMRVLGRGLSADGMKVRQGMYMVSEELDGPANPAHMTVIMDGMPESPYEVISTDYTNYSCVYSCLEYFGFRAEFFWLFSRTPWVSSWALETCQQDLEDMGIDSTKMIEILQGETCPYNSKLDAILEENRKFMMKNIGGQIPVATAPSPTNFSSLDERGRAANEEPISPWKTTGVNTAPKDEDPEADPDDTGAAETPTATRLVCLLALSVALLPVVAR